MSTNYSDVDSGIDLSSYDEEYARAAVPRPETEAPRDDIPDGMYDACIEDVHLTRTATTGNPMILWKLRILGPQCTGRAVTKVRVITSRTLAYLKRDLERLELQLERLSDLPARADEMVDRNVRIYKKTNPDRRWTEVYFLSLHTGERQNDGGGARWSEGTDDDLPF